MRDPHRRVSPAPFAEDFYRQTSSKKDLVRVRGVISCVRVYFQHNTSVINRKANKVEPPLAKPVVKDVVDISRRHASSRRAGAINFIVECESRLLVIRL